jgi:hypothetical protein
MIPKHWVINTVDETIAENAIKILESSKEGMEKMVANNAFMIEEIVGKVKNRKNEKEQKKEKQIA